MLFFQVSEKCSVGATVARLKQPHFWYAAALVAGSLSLSSMAPRAAAADYPWRMQRSSEPNGYGGGGKKKKHNNKDSGGYVICTNVECTGWKFTSRSWPKCRKCGSTWCTKSPAGLLPIADGQPAPSKNLKEEAKPSTAEDAAVLIAKIANMFPEKFGNVAKALEDKTDGEGDHSMEDSSKESVNQEWGTIRAKVTKTHQDVMRAEGARKKVAEDIIALEEKLAEGVKAQKEADDILAKAREEHEAAIKEQTAYSDTIKAKLQQERKEAAEKLKKEKEEKEAKEKEEKAKAKQLEEDYKREEEAAKVAAEPANASTGTPVTRSSTAGPSIGSRVAPPQLRGREAGGTRRGSHSRSRSRGFAEDDQDLAMDKEYTELLDKLRERGQAVKRAAAMSRHEADRQAKVLKDDPSDVAAAERKAAEEKARRAEVQARNGASSTPTGQAGAVARAEAGVAADDNSL